MVSNPISWFLWILPRILILLIHSLFPSLLLQLGHDLCHDATSFHGRGWSILDLGEQTSLLTQHTHAWLSSIFLNSLSFFFVFKYPNWKYLPSSNYHLASLSKNPYKLYATIDYIYGWPSVHSNNGFPMAQTSLNVVETALNFFYLWVLIWSVFERKRWYALGLEEFENRSI